MAKKKAPKAAEPDSIYFLKIVLYFLLGCMWARVGEGVAIPVGLLIGLVFATHDHFRIDRKIEIAILLIATILSFISPIGFILQI